MKIMVWKPDIKDTKSFYEVQSNILQQKYIEGNESVESTDLFYTVIIALEVTNMP